MYTIRFRPDCNLLDIIWQGMFDEEAVVAYARDLRTQFDRSGFQPGYRLRIDMSACPPQTKHALGAFARSFIGFPKASRIAFVTQSAITRLQIKRMMPQPYLQIFEDADEALIWITEDEAPAPFR